MKNEDICFQPKCRQPSTIKYKDKYWCDKHFEEQVDKDNRGITPRVVNTSYR